MRRIGDLLTVGTVSLAFLDCLAPLASTNVLLDSSHAGNRLSTHDDCSCHAELLELGRSDHELEKHICFRQTKGEMLS